jgi:hypothetical protein
MDYSLLIGVHHVDAVSDSSGVKRKFHFFFYLFLIFKDRATANISFTPGGK